jgi:hypothetical protein
VQQSTPSFPATTIACNGPLAHDPPFAMMVGRVSSIPHVARLEQGKLQEYERNTGIRIVDNFNSNCDVDMTRCDRRVGVYSDQSSWPQPALASGLHC